MKKDEKVEEMRAIIRAFRRHATGQETLTTNQVDMYVARERAIHDYYDPPPLTQAQKRWKEAQPAYNWRVPEDCVTKAIFYILEGNVGGALSQIEGAQSELEMDVDFSTSTFPRLWERWGHIDAPSER